MERFLRILTLGAVTLIISLLVGWYWHTLATREPTSEEAPSARIGNVQNLRTSYERWKVGHELNGGDRNLVLTLGWSKSLSAEFTDAKGQAILDLIGGSISVVVRGLPEQGSWQVWLVDNLPVPGGSVRPETGDAMVHVGTLQNEGGLALSQADLGRDTFSNFDVDLVVISRDGQDPGKGGVLFGTRTLFQRLYTRERRGWFKESDSSAPSAAAGSVYASTLDAGLSQLVAEGEALFFNETFDGNGRTCGTCHRADNNFTINPEFIATLPPDDPLFVAEFIDALNFDENGGLRFENPVLMRKFGLIVENLGGTDDLTSKFVMRGVPHVLAQSSSITPAGPLFGSPGPFDGSTVPPNARTGWSGDGAPAPGTLRDFATGAVTQHFPRTTDRVADVDFRLPKDNELDAIEAFLLSLGRQGDPDLSTLNLIESDASAGLALFNGAGMCSACHFNAGANAGFTASPGTENANFNTGVEDAMHPADATGEPRPRDGGFGTAGTLPDGFGNDTFNTPPLVEAADTGPFFHNNAIRTIEGAVAFYNSDAFNDSPAGLFAPIQLEPTEVEAVAAFLRVINALENIERSTELLGRALEGSKASQKDLLVLAINEIEDSILVMVGGGLHADAVAHLQEAKRLAEQASGKGNLVRKAIIELKAARSDMCAPGPNDALLCPL